MRRLVCLLALAAALGPTGARAATPVVAGPGSSDTGWTTPAVIAARGARHELVNLDISFHRLASEEFGPDDAEWCGPLNPALPESPSNPRRFPVGRCPMLWAWTALPLGGRSEVQGLERAVTGRGYPFRCPIFPGMRGTIVVVA